MAVRGTVALVLGVLGVLAVSTLFVLFGAYSGGEAAAAAAERHTSRALLSTDSSDGHCDYGREARKLIKAFQNGEFKRLQNMYHRTAIRYDNGHLFAATNGLPMSAEQWVCAARRADWRLVEGRYFAEAGSRFVGVEYRLYVDGVADALPVYAAFEYDEASCKVSVERMFYDGEHAATAQFMKRVGDDCLGDAVTGSAPSDNVDTARTCFSRLYVTGDAQRLAQCYEDARVVRNGRVVDVESEYSVSALRRLLERVRFNDDVQELALGQRTREDRVGLLVHGTYTLLDDDDENDEAETFAYTAGGLMHFRKEDGALVDVQLVHTNEAPISQALSVDAPAPPRDALVWQQGEALNAYQDALVQLNGPTLVANVDNGNGFALWAPAALALKPSRCYEWVSVHDELTPVPPRSSNDLGLFNAVVQVAVPFRVEPAFREAVHALSPTITYDPLREYITVRAANIGQAMTSAFLAARIAAGEIGLDDTIRTYAQVLRSVVKIDETTGRYKLKRDGSIDYTDAFFSFNTRLCSLIAAQQQA